MSIKDRAVEIISRISGKAAAEITPDMELVANLGLDSAKALELLVELEDNLGIEIEDDDAGKLNTVGDIYAYLETTG